MTHHTSVVLTNKFATSIIEVTQDSKAHIKLKSQCAALQSIQAETFSVGVWTFEVVVANVRKSQVGEMAGCSTDAVRLQQNSCHRSCYVFLEQCGAWGTKLATVTFRQQVNVVCQLLRCVTRHASLNVTRWRTGTQCNCRGTGVMWSQCFVPVMRRAAEFWTDWTFRMRPSDTPCSSELQ